MKRHDRLSGILEALSSRLHLPAARLILAAVMLAPGAACRPPSPPLPEAAIRATNLGSAHYENRQSREALAAFTEAVELAPSSAAAWRNLARARLLARDETGALEALGSAASLERGAAATEYLAGLAANRLSRTEEALAHFEEAVRLDPRTAALRYQLAAVYQASGQREEAATQLAETLRLDPLHAGAHYRLLALARQRSDGEAAARHQLELDRLRDVLSEEERTAEAFERSIHTRPEALASPPEVASPARPVRFTDATGELFPAAAPGQVPDQVADAAVIEVDGDGLPTLLIAAADGRILVARPRPEGGFDLDPLAGVSAAKAGVEASEARIAVGNYHDPLPAEGSFAPRRDALNDALVLYPGDARLLRARPDGGFEDVTAEAGLADASGARARWIDLENDGDLDLVTVGDAGVRFWQNGGEGAFAELSGEPGLGLGKPAVDLAAADLDLNLGLDLMLARGDGPTTVLENLRGGAFRRQPRPPGPWPAAARILTDELDGDGLPDAVLVSSSSAVVVPGAGGRRTVLELEGLKTVVPALLDFDNDGRPDLAVAGDGPRGGLRLWRNGGDSAWEPAGNPMPLAGAPAPLGELRPADVDGDGDTDLLLVAGGGLRFLRNEGGNGGGQLKLRLVGTKSNPSGFGARVEVRRGAFRALRTVASLPLEIGVGTTEPLDVVRVVWTNGIVDSRIDVPVDSSPLTLVEPNVAAGSCPFLYAWDGRRYRFVTDILGNSPLGLSIRRGVPLDADPDELVRIGAGGAKGGFAAATDGYRLMVTEEMREVLYLDMARLVAADHPPSVEVHSTDKLAPAPFPPSELWAIAELRPARAAVGDDGLDRTAELARLDGLFAAPGRPLPPPLRGITRPLALTLDFGPLDGARPLVLALTGWLQYGDASTNIALSQAASARGAPPRLEVETLDGGWRPLDVVVGAPAGKTKTILVDLAGRIPGGARRFRLTTGLEIRWDRIALGERRLRGVQIHEIPPRTARLFQRGFSEIRAHRPGHPTTPTYERISPRPPWRTALAGWLTRYGDVRELAAERDGKLVLVGPGDALELVFADSALPPPAPGTERTFFFYSVGWDKDGDPNVIDGTTIEPLPVAGRGDWQRRYLTRWMAFRPYRRPG